MARIKGATMTHKRRKKMLKLAKAPGGKLPNRKRIFCWISACSVPLILI